MPQVILGDAISHAIERTGDLLFRPFRFAKWRNIAVSAMLTLLGASVPFVNPYDYTRRVGAGPSPLDLAKTFASAHVPLVVGIGITVFALTCLFYLVDRWLSSRGTFMFFSNLVLDDDQIKRPWSEFKMLGNSLFKFRLLWDFISFNLFLLIAAVGALIAWADIRSALITGDFRATGATGFAAVFCTVSVVCAVLLLWVFGSLIFHIAVPVMYIRQLHAWPAVKLAWRELFRPQMGACLLFFLFFLVTRIVRSIWGTFAVLVFLLGTCCCIGYVILIVPIVGAYPIAFLCLPILTFEQALKLQFVSQFGGDYHISWTSSSRGGFPVIMTPSPKEEPRIY